MSTRRRRVDLNGGPAGVLASERAGEKRREEVQKGTHTHTAGREKKKDTTEKDAERKKERRHHHHGRKDEEEETSTVRRRRVCGCSGEREREIGPRL